MDRDYEMGFTCESCGKPLEDSRPPDQDFRAKTDKRLCPECNPTAEELAEQFDRERDRELWEALDDLGQGVEKLKKLGAYFERLRARQTMPEKLYSAEGLGPRAKLRKWRDER